MQAPQEMPNVDATQQSANQRSLLAYCLERNMFVFSIKMALVVGTLLALINHGQAVLTGHFTPDHLLPLLFTYLASTHTQEHLTVLIRVLESRLRGNSSERFGRGKGASPYLSVPPFFVNTTVLNRVIAYTGKTMPTLQRAAKQVFRRSTGTPHCTAHLDLKNAALLIIVYVVSLSHCVFSCCEPNPSRSRWQNCFTSADSSAGVPIE